MEGGVGSLGDRRGLDCSPPPPPALAPAAVRAVVACNSVTLWRWRAKGGGAWGGGGVG
jgi:hypothetical protein